MDEQISNVIWDSKNVNHRDNQQPMMKNTITTSNKRGTKNVVDFYQDVILITVVKKGKEYTVKIDPEDYDKVGLIRITTGGYAYKAVTGNIPIQNLVMDHLSNTKTVVDHINGDRLDNRKLNLRIVPNRENANNRTKGSTNTGVVGISKRQHPKFNYLYFRATVSDRKTKMVTGRSKTKQISKNFNINKLGEELAFSLALKWLEEKKKEFGYLGKD